MNLERLYIENYKQLREPVELLPPEGAIGVVGRNGAGKSTLFESILWAFFGSRGGGMRFSNDLIPWSGGSTKDPTVVEVTLAIGGSPYTVRRQLKSGSTIAEARGPDGGVIVTGAGDVSRWAEENLLGMDRTAFEATFYAKQNELRFFAHDDGISRVRKVSRMLGIDVIEDAQKLLRSDRNELRSEARMLESRLAEADLESLQNELEGARAECRRIEDELQKVSSDYETVETELANARQARAALDAAYRKHTGLLSGLQEAESEKSRAADRAEEAEKDLADIGAAEEELKRLRPQTSRLPQLEAELESLEEGRSRSEERERARQERLRTQTRLATIESELAETLEELDGRGDGEPLPGWDELFELEGQELLEQSAAVLESADGALKLAERRLQELGELQDAHEAYQQAAKEAEDARERYEEAREESERLGEELQEISGGEDLEARERELREEVNRFKELAAARRSSAQTITREAKNLDKAREAIESGDEDRCPTCHRTFDEEEQYEISDTLERQAASIRCRAAQEEAEAEEFNDSARASAEKLQEVLERLQQWRRLKEELARTEDRAHERLERLKRLDERCRELGAKLDGVERPSEGVLEEARAQCDVLRSLRDTYPVVKGLAREHSDLCERLKELAKTLDALASVSYDAQTHREKGKEKARLDQMLGRIGELEKRLETRSEIEKNLERARRREREVARAAKEIRQEITALGFDEAEYEAAGEREATARENLERLRDIREHLGGEWKDADHRIERAASELKRLDADRKLANEKATGASRMDEMDSLFTEFFRSLTSRVRPMLEAEASDLVRTLTDGRYERMEFDENYRVKLVDRFDDSYAIDRFSGGEADVASLCARVALSKIIAARGNETLGFLILDEVFGSLDAERRANVLLALERLKRSFGQIFIISHVGEVQESALIDEIWMIEEDEEGKSSVRKAERSLIEPVEVRV